jgi:hypothetical protein
MVVQELRLMQHGLQLLQLVELLDTMQVAVVVDH